MSGNFTHINEKFTCISCGKNVPEASSSCRNHCPYCLTSVHVDVLPGDRANTCLGLLRAIDYELDPKKGIVLIFKCDRCAAVTRNKSMQKGNTPDDYNAILSLKKQKF